MRPGLLVFNPKAGNGEPSLSELQQRLRRAGFDLRHHLKGEPGLNEAIATETELIVIAGGDGTVGRVNRRVDLIGAPVAILPCGTANNIAYSLGPERGAGEVADRLADAAPGRLDVGLAAGPWGTRPFVESVGVGAIAEITALSFSGSSAPAKLGIVRDTLATMIESARPVSALVEVDGQALEGDHLAVEATNLRRVGPGLPLVPEAKPGDRLIDVVVLPIERRQEIARWLRDGAAGPPPVASRPARHVILRWREGPLRVDGKVMMAEGTGPSRVEISLRRRGLDVLVPPN